MGEPEKLNLLLEQTKKVRALQKRFFSGEKTVWHESAKEEKALDKLIIEIETRTTQTKLL